MKITQHMGVKWQIRQNTRNSIFEKDFSIAAQIKQHETAIQAENPKHVI